MGRFHCANGNSRRPGSGHPGHRSQGVEHHYTYNGFGDVTQLTSPDTGATVYGYDSAGNLDSRLDANDGQGKIETSTFL